MVLAM